MSSGPWHSGQKGAVGLRPATTPRVRAQVQQLAPAMESTKARQLEASLSYRLAMPRKALRLTNVCSPQQCFQRRVHFHRAGTAPRV
jgi:hypothetical protein